MNNREKAKLATSIDMMGECLSISWFDVLSLITGIHLSEEESGEMAQYMADYYD